MENKTTEKCEGCNHRHLLSFDEEDTPSTVVCISWRVCENQKEYTTSESKPKTELNMLEEIMKEIREAGKAIENSIKLLKEYKS